MTAEEQTPQAITFREIPSLIYLLKSAEAASRARMDALLRESNVTTMQYLILGVLLEHKALSGAALARRSFMRPQSMQDIIRALENKGYITRRSVVDDRRERVISITSDGISLMRGLEPRIAAFDAALCEELTPAEDQQLRGLLRQVRTNAQSFQG